MTDAPTQAVIDAIEDGTVKVTRRLGFFEKDGETPWYPEGQPQPDEASLSRLMPGGNVNLSYSRDERRTLDVELDNRDNLIRPKTGGFWYDKVLKIWRGLEYQKRIETKQVTALNHITNPNFEGDSNSDGLADGWNARAAAGTFTKVTSPWGSGTAQQIVVTAAAQDTGFAWPGRLPVTTGQYVTFMCRHNGPADRIRVGIEYFDSTPTYVGGSYQIASGFRGADGFVRHVVQITQANVATVNAMFYTGGISLANDTHKFDQALLVVANEPYTGPFFSGSNPMARWTGATNASTSELLKTIVSYETVNQEWQLGEFCLDNIEGQDFPNIVKVVGRDQTKKMLQSKLLNSASWDAGIKLDDLIKSLAANSGVTKLSRIVGSYPILGKKLDVERGATRWSIAKDAANGKGYDLWFDGEGYLRLEKFPDPSTSPVEWVFKTGPDGGNLVTFSRSVNDSELYNVIIVEGPASDNALPFYHVAKNTEPSSPTSIAEIGERVMDVITLDSAASNADCKAYATALLKIAGLENYTFDFSSIYYPWMDVGVVVQALEPDRNPTDPTRFLLTDLTMSIDLGPMGGNAKRVTIVGDLKEYEEEETTPIEVVVPPVVPPVDAPAEEPELPPTTPVEPVDNPAGNTEEVRIATFNVEKGPATDPLAAALENVAAVSDMIGVQECDNATGALNKFLRLNPGWAMWRGQNEETKQAVGILYRKSLGTVTGKKFTLARKAMYFGPVGAGKGAKAKYVAELQIKLKRTGRTITQFNMHSIAGMFTSKARMGNPEWQRRQDHYADHIQTMRNRINANTGLLFLTGDYNQHWNSGKLAPIRAVMDLDHNYDTHGNSQIDFVAHKPHGAISVVSAKKMPMAISDHDVVIVTYRIRGA